MREKKKDIIYRLQFRRKRDLFVCNCNHSQFWKNKENTHYAYSLNSNRYNDEREKQEKRNRTTKKKYDLEFLFLAIIYNVRFTILSDRKGNIQNLSCFLLKILVATIYLTKYFFSLNNQRLSICLSLYIQIVYDHLFPVFLSLV